MLHKILISFCLFLSLFACNSTTKKNVSTSKTSNKHEKQLDTLANRYLELGRFSGTILISQGNSVIFHKHYGMADYSQNKSFTDHTPFKIGDLSEIFVSEIIKDLAKQNVLELSQPINTYIPQIKHNFTVEEALNHRLKFQNIAQIKAESPKVEYSTIKYLNLSEENKKITPSSLDYNILGILIEEVTNKKFQAVLEEYTKKWALENTFFENEDTTQLAKGYLFHNYRGNGLELEKSPSYTNHIAFSSTGIKSTAKDLMNFTKKHIKGNFNRNGYLMEDGFSYALRKNQEKDRIIIILSNRRHPVADEISKSIEHILDKTSYQLPILRKEIQVEANTLKKYAGVYALNQNVNLNFVVENDSLFVLMGNRIHLKAQANNQFYMPNNDAAIRFVTKNESDSVKKAILLNGFLEGDTILRVK